MTLVTCRTPDCGNSGIPIDMILTYTDETGQVHPVDSVVCGVCSQQITDVAAD